MKKRCSNPLHKVKQLLEADSIAVTNILIGSGDWILINTYKKHRGRLYYILGRIADF